METQQTIGYLLQHVASLQAKQSDQVLQEQLGIGMSQFKIMRALHTVPRITQREIANHLGQTEASISRQVKGMIEGGLLQMTRTPADKREHRMIVTSKGERFIVAAMTALSKYHAPTFANLSPARQAQLREALEALHTALCGDSHPDPTK